jgi:hypothetical protein
MQCKDCTHQTVCMHKAEFDRLEGQLPVTDYPFKSTVTCTFYRQEQPQSRAYTDNHLLNQNFK